MKKSTTRKLVEILTNPNPMWDPGERGETEMEDIGGILIGDSEGEGGFNLDKAKVLLKKYPNNIYSLDDMGYSAVVIVTKPATSSQLHDLNLVKTNIGQAMRLLDMWAGG